MTKKKLDHWPSKSHKPIDHRPQAKPTNPAKHPQAKPTNPAKQWHQQNPQTHQQNPQIQPNNGINKTHKPISKTHPQTQNQQPQTTGINKFTNISNPQNIHHISSLWLCDNPPPTTPQQTENQQIKPKPTKLQHTHKKLKLHMLNWVSNESNVTTMDILENLILYSWLTLELVYLFRKYIDLRVTMIRLEHIEPWYLK